MWLQELRSVRRRLEDRLLCGSGTGCALQVTRAGLELDVEQLQEAKDELTQQLQLAVQEGSDRAALEVRSHLNEILPQCCTFETCVCSWKLRCAH